MGSDQGIEKPNKPPNNGRKNVVMIFYDKGLVQYSRKGRE
jgi:hypothetical protein